MKKAKVLSMVMALVMLFSMITGGQAVLAAASLVGEFWFEEEIGTITGYAGAGGAVEIPSTIGGTTVLAIGADAFRDKSNITSISIPNSVTSIGEHAFFQCYGLKSISVPIQATTVASATFQYCTGIENITIPEGVITIEDRAFYQCTNNESIVIPSTVTSIGDFAFSTTSGTNPKLSQAFFIGDAPAIGNGIFKIVDTDFKVYYPNNKTGYTEEWSKTASTTVSGCTFPDGCTLVGYDPAAEYTVTYDGNGSTSGTVPTDTSKYKTTNTVAVSVNTLTKDNNSFTRWNTKADGTGTSYDPGDKFVMGKENVVLYAQWLPTYYKIIKGTIAHGSISIKMYDADEADDPEIDRVDETAFGKEGGPDITVTLTPEAGYRYKEGTLKYNNGTIDYSISYNSKTGEYTFEMPESDITVTAEFESETSDYSFDEASGTLQKYYGEGGNVTIPSNINGVDVKSIGDEAFMYCDDLTGITVPEGVTLIDRGAFAGCTSLSGISLPDSLAEISDGAFYGCTEFESIIIPGNVDTLGNYAFGGCSNLFSACFKGNAPGSVGTNPFIDTNAAFKIYYKTGVTGFTNPWNGYVTDIGYTVSVGALSGGSITPVPSMASSGAAISLTITPDSGKQLKSGTLKYNDGTKDVAIRGTSFELPAADVTITAQFEDSSTTITSTAITGVTAPVKGAAPVTAIPGTSAYTAAISWSPAATSFAASTTYTATITITPKTGYTLTGVPANFFTVAGATSVTNTTGSGIVIAVFPKTAKSASNSGTSSGDNTTSPATTSAPTPAPIISETPRTGNGAPSVTGIANADAKDDGKGKAAAALTESQVKDALNKALAEAAQRGGNTEARVEIKVTAPAGAKSVEAGIPKAAVDAVAGSKAVAMSVSTPLATLSFDGNSLDTISKEAGNVKISISKVDTATLSIEAKNTVGDRPVFNFSVASGDKTISQFGGTVSVSIPYTPKAGEDLNAIVIYYINAEGKLEIVSNCAYDPATGTIQFKTNHFSIYAAGYNKVSFKDVAANAWYSKAVGFVAARGITEGTGNGNFSPEAKLTRGQLLVMLMKAYGISPDKTPKDNFADAGNTYYTGYLAAAKRLGISNGVGNNRFAPEKDITQQEMYTLTYNTLKSIGQMPANSSAKTLKDFTDADKVATWAKDAMTFMANNGIVVDSGSKLYPDGKANRAHMAQVLYNLLAQ
jgi:hypothetical protein